MKDQKIVLFIFAGREENMRVQMPYLRRLLDTYPNMEVHLWDLTRRASDAAWIRDYQYREPERVKVMHFLHPGHPIRCMYPGAQQRRRGYPPCRCMLHKPPYEKPYQWYAAHPEYADHLFVKIDDDVLFLETDRFDDLIAPLADNPETVYSANVVNNAVCAKYATDVGHTQIEFNLGSPNDPAGDKDWWELHTYANFARWSHDRFLKNADETNLPPTYQPTREGEAISINCIAFTFQTMAALATAFKSDSRLGDEGAVDALLPVIATTFRVAHLSFGPQEKAMGEYELNYYRAQYTDLRKGYLGE